MTTALQTIVQIVETHWTKQSRGAAGATIRNALPEVLPIPTSVAPSGPILLHHAQFRESDNFTTPRSTGLMIFGAHDETTWRLRIEPADDGGVDVLFYGSRFQFTSGRSTDKARLPANTWLQIVSNMREAHEDYWCYRKFVYNIVHARQPDASLLLRTTAPVRRIDRQIQLR